MASLGIEDLVVGQGDTASSGQRVTVHYTGWLDNNGNQGANSTRRGIATSRSRSRSAAAR